MASQLRRTACTFGSSGINICENLQMHHRLTPSATKPTYKAIRHIGWEVGFKN